MTARTAVQRVTFPASVTLVHTEHGQVPEVVLKGYREAQTLRAQRDELEWQRASLAEERDAIIADRQMLALRCDELAAALRDLLNLSDARGYLPSQNIAPVEAARATLAKGTP